MKKWMIIITVCFSILSCEKNGNENSYCVNTIKNSPTITTLSESEMNAIKYLFSRNHLDYTKYQFTKFVENPFLKLRYVYCNSFASGLIIFDNEIRFDFDENDNFCNSMGGLFDVVISNTKASMKQDNVVEVFIGELKRDGWIQAYPEILEGCFGIEFGCFCLYSLDKCDYYFTKAWKITQAGIEYPLAYINDENSELIYYFNGIQYLKMPPR